ncbi:flagellar protein export ATPase FliI [candidate division LCP-89 bacterium B3_LCP]|uniref:Flagellar protein export ATPase FliI n=1 Tax=candidate division LCP-89 bacterium B3_LCP TaxID=2012998 RepID=A0A532V5H2_UNCL8|nr:MAG: flagellar protein export ATPase FliI [candidate division LCP-89 bacterium B3_LCP]
MNAKVAITDGEIAERYRPYFDRLDECRPMVHTGRISDIIGVVVTSIGPSVAVGEVCRITSPEGQITPAEVVGFRGNRVLLMPLGPIEGIAPGYLVTAEREPFRVPVGGGLLGRVLDGLGRPIDDKGPLIAEGTRPASAMPPAPLERQRIKEPLVTGIRSIDALLTCGKGQRVGIFSAAGVGKSILLGMIARNTSAEVNVIGLIGERGREVREFIEKDLGEEGLKRSVVIAVTSDQPALIRIKGAHIATSIAEYFRDQGMDVMLLMDSVTRLAMAQREVGLAIGEPPTTRGYTPSVFAMLPKLMERAGASKKGSITGMYTILVEADDMNEPVSDAVRSILDGHIVLSRKLAARSHYPAVDVLESISRLMTDIIDDNHLTAARKILEHLAVYRDAEDLINIGAYVAGSNAKIDLALEKMDAIWSFLRQDISQKGDFNETLQSLRELAA